MSDINLLPKSTSGPQKQEYIVSIFRRVSFVLLFATALITISLFVLVISSPLKKVQEQENKFLVTMDRSKIKISKNVIIQERLRSITEIIQKRNNYEKYTGAILAILPPSVNISSLEIDKEGMQLIGNSRSLESINTYFTAIVALQSEKKFIQSAVVKSLSSESQSGQFSFTLQMKLL